MDIKNKVLDTVTGYVSNSPKPIYNLFRKVQNFHDKFSVNKYIRNNVPLILVYQYGRVASTSVYSSLKSANLNLPIYHVHTLSTSKADEWIENAKKNNQRIDRNYVLGRIIGERLETQKFEFNKARWKIVCVFRDPISVIISLHFLNPRGHFKDILDKYGDNDYEKVTQYFRDLIKNDDPSGWLLIKWFDDVFQHETTVDVFQHEFDKVNGYTIIKDKRFDILLLRFENLSDAFKKGASELFLKDPVDFYLRYSHIHKIDDYKNIQKYVTENLKLDKETCEKVYSTKFIKHFYSDELIEKMVKKWSNE